MPTKRRRIAEDLSAILGQRLAAARQAHNLTQEQLADLLGVSQSNISLYERGVTRIPTDLVVKLATSLRVSSDELLGLAPAARYLAMKDRRILRRLELIDRLPKRDRDVILGVIKACLARVQGGNGSSSAHRRAA